MDGACDGSGDSPLRTIRPQRHSGGESAENRSSTSTDNSSTYAGQPVVAASVMRSATSDEIDTKSVRQNFKMAATRTSTDDLHRSRQTARSCSPRQMSSASVRRRFSSSFERAGRRTAGIGVDAAVTHRLNESFDDSLSSSELDYASPISIATSGSAVILGRSSLSRASPKEQQRCTVANNNDNDKENESPKIVDLLNSPKMKVSDNALAEQNSPRSFDSTSSSKPTAGNRFTFSPRHIFGDDYHGSTASAAAIVAASAVTENAVSSTGSPLISSALYKHGNYFRFPDVDCITPDNAGAATDVTKHRTTAPSSDNSTTASVTAVIGGGLKTQPSRRVRLKSISLDSDGARLVEDNLGVPVEELIEHTTTSETLVPANSPIVVKTVEAIDRLSLDGARHESAAKSANRKNKNNLKINIGQTTTACNYSSIKTDKVQTPKTPTLTQTKQKAVSLDSSDTTAMSGCCCPASASSSSSRKPHLHQHSIAAGSRSTHHLSSISVPTTPKRNANLTRKKGHCHASHHHGRSSIASKTAGTVKSSYRQQQHQQHQPTPASITSLPGTDCRLQQLMCDDDRSLRIAIDIDDNFGECAVDEMDDDVNIENFYMGEIDDGDMVILAGQGPGGQRMAFLPDSDTRKRPKNTAQTAASDSCDYLLLGSNLQSQKFGVLSLSNNNLETLPEAMTLTDFECPASRDDAQTIFTINAHERRAANVTDELASVSKRSSENDVKLETVPSKQATRGGNILQRRGSNQSLTINLNGSLGNLTKYMSASNYSLGSSFTGSNCNLNAPCPQHLLSMCHPLQSNASSTQSVLTHGYGSSQTNILQPNTSPIQQQHSFETDVSLSEVGGASTKKNLLQRRGSNTSLTLNIKGSSHANLSRFSSHSSLNISSAHTTMGSAKFKHGFHLSQQQVTPITIATSIQSGHYQQPSHHQLVRQQPVGKKGLLERRNSNASLTLNIHNNGLSNSSYNLRASACSLNNIPNMSIECYEQGVAVVGGLDQESCDLEVSGGELTGAVVGVGREQRKYLSSDNLNTMMLQCNKLNQTHIRNSTKTCFGSVSDLKPSLTSTQVTPSSSADIASIHQRLNDGGAESAQTVENAGVAAAGPARGFEQTVLCSCTGVRNITTKPLSPQSTSEDFKMYLANIQLLQNATNVLTEEHLRKFHHVFKGYGYEKRSVRATTTMAAAQETSISDVTSSSAVLELFGAGERRSSARTPFQRQPGHETAICDGDDDDDNGFLLKGATPSAPPSDEEKRRMLRSLHAEFWDLPTNHQEKPLVFGSQSKNRYKTILPNEHSRVLLETESNGLTEPYINANYIKGPDYTKNSYIVTQGPLPNTIYDYWLMVRQNVVRSRKHLGQQDDILAADVTNSQKMIMLTNFIESNQQKCSIYFPIEVNDAIFVTQTNEKFENQRLAALYKEHAAKRSQSAAPGPIEIEIPADSVQANEIPRTNHFLIENSGMYVRNGFSIRKFQCIYVVTNNRSQADNVVHQTLDQFTCYHYWFPDWPDHHSPDDVGLLLDMGLHVLDIRCELMDFSDPAANQTAGDDDHDDEGENGAGDGEHDENHLRVLLNISTRGDIEPMPIIHCSAGIGRTGCLAAILNGVRQMRQSIVAALRTWNNQLSDESVEAIRNTKNLVNVDILGIVCNLRLQRGGMVQNSEQYELIHRAMCLYQTRIDTELIRWTDKDKDKQPAAGSGLAKSDDD